MRINFSKNPIIMRKSIFLLLATAFLISYAEPDEIVLVQEKPIKNRSGLSVSLDQPSVYYDNDTQEMIIYGGGAVSNYEVEISSAINGCCELYTLVNGTYDTFDVSSLPAGSHIVTITSPLGDVYEGTFYTY